MVANGTPCERSVTSSREGQRVATMRARRSSRSASGTWIANGRIPLAVFSATAVMSGPAPHAGPRGRPPKTGPDAGTPKQRHRHDRCLPGRLQRFSGLEVPPGSEGPPVRGGTLRDRDGPRPAVALDAVNTGAQARCVHALELTVAIVLGLLLL